MSAPSLWICRDPCDSFSNPSACVYHYESIYNNPYNTITLLVWLPCSNLYPLFHFYSRFTYAGWKPTYFRSSHNASIRNVLKAIFFCLRTTQNSYFKVLKRNNISTTVSNLRLTCCHLMLQSPGVILIAIVKIYYFRSVLEIWKPLESSCTVINHYWILQSALLYVCFGR